MPGEEAASAARPGPVRVGVAIGAAGAAAETALILADHAEKIGADSIWLAQLPHQLESSVLLAALAAHTSTVRLGTAVLPLYHRPPVVMALSAMTIDELSHGRVVLGLGLGHRDLGAWSVGVADAPALAGTREYLEVVGGLIRDGEVNLDGRWYSGHAHYPRPRRRDLPVQLGTFGPRMIELAAEVADGVILWMCSADYVRTVAWPALERGWRLRGGRPRGFAVTAMLHAGLTGVPDEDRADFTHQLAAYLRVPSYRRLFAASGFTQCLAANRPDAAMVAALSAFTEDELARHGARYRAAGVDEIVLSAAGSALTSLSLCLSSLSRGRDVLLDIV
jgi:5,10-methylenetetrahydromethanopterin reductase